jgi:integrase
MGKLTARKCKSAAPGKYTDGDGLRLHVYASGARTWVYRYMLRGRSREMGLGGYPEVSLAEARESAAHYRKILKSGVDPIAHREERRKRKALETAKAITFVECAARYIRSHRHGWTNRKHARQWVSTLKTYARPMIGDMSAANVGTEDVLKVLSPIWTAKTETAKRLQGRIENILDWATARQYRSGENPARWRGHLDKILPRPTRVKRVSHHPALPYPELPAFMTELREQSGTAARALEFAIRTAARTGEVLGAKWSEIDLDAGIWNIPPERMKAKRPHRVPLTAEALAILADLPRVNDYIFAGVRYGRPLSNMAMLQLMRRMGFGVNGSRGDYVPHGFRSSFRDWTAEQTSFPREVAEAALAHVNADKVEAAYLRGDLFEKRRRMMEAWAQYLSPEARENIVPIRWADHIARDQE